MRTESDLFGYQSQGVDAAASRRQLALLLPPGYGKTVVTETALARLGAWPALVVAPARVVQTDVWGAEAREWEHLKNLIVQPLDGTEAARRKKLRRDSHVEVVSYENLRWLTETVDMRRRYGSIVFDELSKMKHAETRRFKRMRSGKGGVEIPVRLGLTGSPAGNHAMDLWGELYMVAGEKPLGPTFAEFVARYFKPSRFAQTAAGLRAVAWELLPGAKAEIFKRVAQYSFALPPQASVKVPPVRVNRVHVPMSAEHRRVSNELQKRLFVQLQSGAELETLSRSEVGMKLRQLAGGSVWLDADAGRWEQVHTAKLDALAELVGELQGEPLLVFYWFRHELEAILERFPQARALDSAEDVAAWNRGEVEMLLAHPQSAGHGLNLQHGGNHLAWFTIPWSHELREQGEARLARTGQLAPWVTSHWLLCGGMDEWVALVLDGKGAFQQELFDAVVKENA